MTNESAAAAAAPLCKYCQLQPPRVGHLYCCDACQTLDELSLQSPQLYCLPETDEDRLIKSHFGTIQDQEIQLTCQVERLVCEACVQHLSQLRNWIPELTDLRWDRGSSTLSLNLPAAKSSPSHIFDLLAKMGLKPRWINPQDVKRQQNQTREALTRLGITGALLGNMMLFAVPIYGGLTGDLAQLFFWIQGLLFLPVLFWSAKPFFITSLVSLRLRQLSTDLPLTLAFVVGSLLSYFALFTQKWEWIYFDSLNGFLFFILLARYLLERSLWKTQNQHELDHFFERAFYLVENSQQVLKLEHWDNLKAGDIIKVKLNQRLPADGYLLQSHCELDTSWVSGEFWPQTYLENARLTAGSLVVSPACRYQISATARDSDFVRLLNRLKQKGQKLQSGIESKIGVALVAISFALALALFVFAPHLGLEELIKRSLALWIVACPCAVSFAAPLTRSMGSLLAEKLGFWMRDISAFERLHQVKKIAFDKTGTLTDSFLNLNLNLPMLDPYYKQLILSLENISDHPIAKALRNTLGVQELMAITQNKEIIGQGVEGYLGADFFELKKSTSLLEQAVELKKNGIVILTLNFDEQVHPRLKDTFHELIKSYQIFILSGDHPERVKKLGNSLGLESQNIIGGLTPENKQQTMQELKPDLYIGDGTNDILALKEAPVSLSFGNASIEAQTASQIIMTHSEFERLPLLFRLSLEVQKLLKRNLIIALSYNAGAAAASLLGWVGPLEAAILMPIASLFLLLSTFVKTPWLRNLERKRI